MHASRDLFDLPGGKVAFGGGYQYFHKATNSNPGASIPSQVTGQQTGDPAFTIGAQDDNAAFAARLRLRRILPPWVAPRRHGVHPAFPSHLLHRK